MDFGELKVLRSRLQEAVRAEHPCSGGECGITKALNNGCLLLAAYLLDEVTDAPETARAALALAQYMGAAYETELEEERQTMENDDVTPAC